VAHQVDDPGAAGRLSPERGVLIIVSAPSGGGKSTLTRGYVEAAAGSPHPAVLSVSCTTRAPRPGEVDGEHYHFIDRGRFDALVAEGAFLEHAEVFGRCYGTSRAATESQLAQGHDVILDIDWQGARQVRAAMPEAVSIFILPPSTAALETRLRERAQDDDAEIARRMRAARDEMRHFDEFDYLLVNDDIARARADFAAIIRAARLRRQVVASYRAGLIADLLGEG